MLPVFILVLHSSPWLPRYPFFASYLVLTSRMLSRIEEAHRGSVRWKQSGKSCSVQTIRLNTDPFVRHIHQHTSHSTLSPLNVGENTQVPSLTTAFQYYRGRIGRPAWFASILLPWCAWISCVPCTPSDRLWVSCIKYILFYDILSYCLLGKLPTIVLAYNSVNRCSANPATSQSWSDSCSDPKGT